MQPPSLSSCSTLSSPQKETLHSVSTHSPLPLKGLRLYAGPGLHPSAVVSHPLEPSGGYTKHFSLQGFPPHQPVSWGLTSPPLLQRAFLCPTLCQSHLHLSLLLLSHFSRVRLYGTPSLGFPRQEHWSGLPFPSPMHKGKK